MTVVRHAVWAFLIMAVPCAMAQGVNLLANGNAAEGMKGWKGFRGVVPDPDGGDASCFVLGAGGKATSKEFIPVDPSKNYILRGWFRSQEDIEARIYFGVDCYDANEVQIASAEVNVVPGTETTLGADAAVGDTILKVTDASQWKADGAGTLYGRVAFNVDDTGNLKDLPNRDITGSGIPTVRQVADGWEIDLSMPLEKAYPKGTKIRQHRNKGAFCYVQEGMNLKVNAIWLEKPNVFSANSASGDSTSGDRFWPGTRFVRVAVVSDFPKDVRERGAERGAALVRDLSFSLSD